MTSTETSETSDDGPDGERITITYGPDPSEFGQLWLPGDSKRVRATIVLIHGGFWRQRYALDLMDPLAKDLTARGYAAWNIEYRRVGQPGGGYPGTLTDVAQAVDMVATIRARYGIENRPVAVVGHSAGGHLAMWLAGRPSIANDRPGASPSVTPDLAIGLGPVVNLRAGDADGLGSGAVTDFLGGSASDVPDRYDDATPSTQTPVARVVVQGSEDGIVPAHYTLPDSGQLPSNLRVVRVPGDHFALIDPKSQAWEAVLSLLSEMSGG